MSGKTTSVSANVAIQWDVENWSRALDFWCARSTLSLEACRAIEIGARDGGLSLWLAGKGATAIYSDVVAPDTSVRDRHSSHGVADRVRYVVLNGCCIPFNDASVDIVMFKSVLGALRTFENQKQMFREIYRVLRPGGELWFAENLQASVAHKTLRRLFVSWGTRWRYMSLKELNSLCAGYQESQIEPHGFFGAFGRTEKQRRLLGKIDRGIDPLIPKRWRYIAFGWARR